MEKKMISLEDYHKKQVFIEVESILLALEEDYDIEVKLSLSQVYKILDFFYHYYEKKQIQYLYENDLINYFNYIASDAVEISSKVDLEFVLDKLELYTLLESPLELNPKEIRKILRKGKEKWK